MAQLPLLEKEGHGPTPAASPASQPPDYYWCSNSTTSYAVTTILCPDADYSSQRSSDPHPPLTLADACE
jgi:hypothetical protein